MILAVTPIWGQRFWDTFARTILPSLGKEILALNDREPVTWLLWTPPDDWHQWATHPAVSALRHLWCIKNMNANEVGPLNGGYMGMMHLLRRSVHMAWEKQAKILFLTPDVVFSEGSLVRAWEKIEEGAGAVVIPRVRAIRTAAEPLIRQRNQSDQPMTPGWLAKVAEKHMDPLMRSQFEDAENFTKWPSVVCRKAEHGYSIKGHHLFVLMAKPNTSDPNWVNIDFDWIERAVSPWTSVHVPADSDEIMALDLTEDNHLADLIGREPKNAGQVDMWVRGHAHEYHHWLANHEYRVRVPVDA